MTILTSLDLHDFQNYNIQSGSPPAYDSLDFSDFLD